MDLRKLKTLIDLVSESGVAELEIEEGEDRVRIVNRPSATPQAMPAPSIPPIPVTPVALPATVEAAPAQEAPAPAAAPAGLTITSPMVGTFYRAPSPGADPFVKEGDAVKKGQTIGIIEAMKLLNEVEADQDGIVKSFCVENGQPVEFGQPLLVLE